MQGRLDQEQIKGREAAALAPGRGPATAPATLDDAPDAVMAGWGLLKSKDET